MTGDKTSSKRQFDLFPAEEVEPGEIRRFDLNGIGIAVVRTPTGDFHAFRDVCPHLGAKLSLGKLERIVEASDVGCYRLTDEFAVRCPWHGHEFGIVSGQCLAEPNRIRVRSYQVEVVDGRVVLWR